MLIKEISAKLVIARTARPKAAAGRSNLHITRRLLRHFVPRNDRGDLSDYSVFLADLAVLRDEIDRFSRARLATQSRLRSAFLCNGSL